MERYPSKDINVHQLNEEIAVLDLPGFVGVGHLSRERDEDGVTQRVAAYILVKVDTLTGTQKSALTTVIQAHVPV